MSLAASTDQTFRCFFALLTLWTVMADFCCFNNKMKNKKKMAGVTGRVFFLSGSKKNQYTSVVDIFWWPNFAYSSQQPICSSCLLTNDYYTTFIWGPLYFTRENEIHLQTLLLFLDILRPCTAKQQSGFSQFVYHPPTQPPSHPLAGGRGGGGGHPK